MRFFYSPLGLGTRLSPSIDENGFLHVRSLGAAVLPLVCFLCLLSFHLVSIPPYLDRAWLLGDPSFPQLIRCGFCRVRGEKLAGSSSGYQVAAIAFLHVWSGLQIACYFSSVHPCLRAASVSAFLDFFNELRSFRRRLTTASQCHFMATSCMGRPSERHSLHSDSVSCRLSRRQAFPYYFDIFSCSWLFPPHSI